MIMMISHFHQGIILHIIIVLHQRCLSALNASRDTLYFYTLQFPIRVTHRNGAIKHIFYTNQIHGGIIGRLFFIHLSLHALALHLAVKILLQIFLYEDLSTLSLTYICQLYFTQNANRTALCYAANAY